MEHPLSDMMTNTMSKIKDMIDVNTVVGSPITTPGGVTIMARVSGALGEKRSAPVPSMMPFS